MKPTEQKSPTKCPHCGSNNTRLDFDSPETMSCCKNCLCDYITDSGEITLNPDEIV